jgi:hypothetical protein
MSRSADYTIKGFLYQFNKTLLEILNADDDSIITVEGIIEDVDVKSPEGVEAIQCKYHEASETFKPSTIYKPLLQMMHHFHTNHSDDISYILYAHFGGVDAAKPPKVGMKVFLAALSSSNKEYEKYVKGLKGNIDLDAFLDTFKMEFGPSYGDLVQQVGLALEANGFAQGDIETLAYPNAINLVADHSVRHDSEARKITKLTLIKYLKTVRKTAITHWTLALSTCKKLLDARRRQLKAHLDINSRLRYFIIDAECLDDFEDSVVLFVRDYIAKYHSKVAHTDTPVICLRTTKDSFEEIQYRLYNKGVTSTDGYIAKHFESRTFYRDPLVKGRGTTLQREFLLRLLRWDDNAPVLNQRKCDDLFLIGSCDCEGLDTQDVNVECLAAKSFKDIKYIMGVSNVYE